MILKSVPEYPSLWAGEDGNVYTDSGGENRKREIWRKGYRRVRVSRKKQGRQVRVELSVHVLVCSAFKERVVGREDVLHKNGLTQDCRPENLYWGDGYDNWEDRRFHEANGKGSVRGAVAGR